MATIKFINITSDVGETLIHVFDFLAQGKRSGAIDEHILSVMLGERYKTKFWWPTKNEKVAWMKKWQATPIETRHTDPNLKTPWDFGSWVDAILYSEIELESLILKEDGSGEIRFKQLSWPSGGIEATEEIVKIFDGQVISNDAI